MLSKKKLKKDVFQSILSSYFIQFSISLMNIITQIIIARFFLFPKQYGIFLYALFIFTIINNLRDLGLSNHLIRKKNIDYTLVFNLFLWTSLLIFIGHIIYFLIHINNTSNKDFLYTLLIMSFSYIPSALGSIPSIYLIKHIKIKKTIFPRIFSMFLFMVFSILFSYLGLNSKSLALGKFIQSLSFTVLMYIFYFDIKIKLKFELKKAIELLKESYKFFIVDNIGLLASEIYNFVIKLYVGYESLANYRIAYLFISFPQKIIEQAFYKVFYPLVSKYKNNNDKINNIYKYFTVIIFSLEIPIYFFIFFNADSIIYLTYGLKYKSAAILLQMLAFLPIFMPFTTFGIEILKVKHKDNSLLLYSVSGCFFIILFAFILTSLYEAKGMVIANYLGLNYLFLSYYIYKKFKNAFFYIWSKVLFVFILSYINIGLLTNLTLNYINLNKIISKLVNFFLISDLKYIIIFKLKILNNLNLINDITVNIIYLILTLIIIYFIYGKKLIKKSRQ